MLRLLESRSTPRRTDPRFKQLENPGDRDVVMVLDESGSLNENQILIRNKEANIFVRMLTKNCSLGTVFFSGKTHKKKGRDSLYKDTKQDEYLKAAK